MKLSILAAATASALLLAAPQLSRAGGGWEEFSTEEYGYSMLIPAGTQMQTKEWGGGWGGLYGKHEGVTIYGLAKLGAQEAFPAIEQFGVTLTGVPAAAWTQVDAEVDNGWTSYKTVLAQSGDQVVVGGYGVGSSGSYLILLHTTASDYAAHEADYHAWYESAKFH